MCGVAARRTKVVQPTARTDGVTVADCASRRVDDLGVLVRLRDGPVVPHHVSA